VNHAFDALVEEFHNIDEEDSVMRRGRLALVMALMAVMALMVATTGSIAAANKTQAPILSFSLSATPNPVSLNGTVNYTATFMVNKNGAKNVALTMDFLRGLDLDGLTPALFDGAPVTATQTFAAVDRNTYSFALPDLAATPNFTTHTLTFSAFVTPGYYTARSAVGKQLKANANLYVGGQWKAKGATSTNLVP
jgi:hypothetical protein